MTIEQILRKQDHYLDNNEVAYTDDNRIRWHCSLIKNCKIFANCPVQTFKVTVRKNGTGPYSDKYCGSFSVNSENLPKDITAVENYTCPARKTDLESDNLTVRDYLQIQKNIKKIYFTRFQPYSCADTDCKCHLYWHTDLFDVQDLSGSLSFMADILVDRVRVSDTDESVLQVFLLTREVEKWKEQEKERKKERKKEELIKKQEKERLGKKLDIIFGIFLFIGVVIGAILGWFAEDGVNVNIRIFNTIICAFLGFFTFMVFLVWWLIQKLNKIFAIAFYINRFLCFNPTAFGCRIFLVEQ